MSNSSSMDRLAFNKPYVSGKEYEYIADAVQSRKLSGNGKYTRYCQDYFETNYGFRKCLLTTSCTDALEMAALLLNIGPGDEVIMPSYTFVSTANAFVLRGAKIVFADSRADHPGIDEESIESLITPATKAIVPVHYAGVACNMDKIMEIAGRYGLFVVEDAAQAIDSFYTGSDGVKRALGSIGHLSAFSFHETKNIISGEGGMLVINDPSFVSRAEIIWEKGTNRSAFYRGEIDKYNWVDMGSSFLPSEIIAAFLWAQLEQLPTIQSRRNEIWNEYHRHLATELPKANVQPPFIPDFATNNAHMYYLIFANLGQRTSVVNALKEKNIDTVFHYLSLHRSPFYIDKHKGKELLNTDRYSDCLLRLPFYFDLNNKDIQFISEQIILSANS
jgi:dTDP-4-amino-4,6-dideoxygalactose transaminase